MTRDIPPEAIQAAAEAIERELLSGRDYTMALESDEALARAALEAAAPIIAAAERERCAQLLNAKGDEIGRDTFNSVSVPISAAAFHDAADFIRREGQP